MKKMIIITMTILAVMAFVGTSQTKYSMNGTVVETYDNVIVLEDARGQVWTCEGSTDKENVKIIFDNNGTDNIITDDSVVGIR